MSTHERDVENRESYRCTVSGSRQEGELKVGSTRLPIRLLDESVGGFSVLADEAPGVETDDVVQLRTASGWSEARVVSVTRIATVGNDHSEDPERPTEWFRLGLFRLGELDIPEEDRSVWAGLNLRYRLAGLFPSSSPMAVFGFVFALVTVVAGMGTMLLLLNLGQLATKQGGRWSDRLSTAAKPSQANRKQPAAATRRSVPAEQPIEIPGMPTLRRSASEGVDRLRRTVQRLPGATAFNLPEVIRELRLTDAQQNEIRRIVDTTAESLHQLDAPQLNATREQRAEIRAKVLERARQRALGVLTDGQRARWDRWISREDGP